MSIRSINPATEEIVRAYDAHSKEIVGKKIQQTHDSWLKWKEISYSERAALLRTTAGVLQTRKAQLAETMAIEMGKPLKAGIAEIEKCAWVCEYYAENGEAFLRDEVIDTDAQKSYVSFLPLGVVLAIMPWNFPFWQVFRFLAPALMAGNCGLLKHASNVPGCALAIEDIIKEAGYPEHVFQTLLIGGEAVNEVIENPLIRAVTLTGSTEAGMKVAQKAGSVLKKTVLELGGSDPYIILGDADLKHAAHICAESRLINSGQSCIAAKRFIVVKEVEDDFIALFREEMSTRVSGDPLDEKTQLGPLARPDLRDQVHKQVTTSIEKGANCILGGEIPEGKGAFYPPTILTNVKKGTPAYDEEVFGPVAAIISAMDEQDALRIANDTSFGLGAAIFTKDLTRGEEIAKRHLNAGSCFINSLVKSDPRLPFGGINQSGYGRELGIYGIKEFVNIKTVYVQPQQEQNASAAE
jgi:succinate-semialdehyde dehydrogenase / glutarate-semialdehyde dehydrogenase